MSPYSLETSFHSHFAFMFDQFEFSIVDELYHQEMGNAYIVFKKPPTLVGVSKDRGQILASLRDERLDRREWIEFADAVQFLSGNPELVYAFPSVYNDETVEIQLSHVSSVMHQNCLPILTGELIVIQLKEAIHARKEQEIREFFAKFLGSQ